MNNRIGLIVLGGVAALILLAVVTAIYVVGRNSEAAVAPPENGSFLHPQVMREDLPGYIIAELYQDVGMDVRSGVYDQEGNLLDRYWSYDAPDRACSVDLVLADQHGRDEIAPTATPRPPDATTTPGPVKVLPAIYKKLDTDDPMEVLPDRTVVIMPTPTPAGWTGPTPYPTATPVVVAATGWDHWKGRPVAIEADGLAVLDVPRDARVSAYLSVRTGPNSGSLSELARMPLPDAHWYEGSAYVRLTDASGRILLESDAVDANYRAAVLHLEISPLPDCAGLRLRWKRSAAVAVKALTEQPFSDWGGRAAPPVTPPPSGVALYATISSDMSSPPYRFVPADFLLPIATTSTVAGHIVIPAAPDPNEDYFIGFAIRSDLAPNGLSDIRQTGSAFNARDAFFPPMMTGMRPVPMLINGAPYQMYDSNQAWDGQLLGGEWSLSP